MYFIVFLTFFINLKRHVNRSKIIHLFLTTSAGYSFFISPYSLNTYFMNSYLFLLFSRTLLPSLVFVKQIEIRTYNTIFINDLFEWIYSCAELKFYEYNIFVIILITVIISLYLLDLNMKKYYFAFYVWITLGFN